MTVTTIPLVSPPARDIAAAVMVAEDGRYLLQLRDPKPDIHLPDHWTTFGGGLEAGEDAETALRRELSEELTWTAREVTPLVTSVHSVGARDGLWRVHYFTVPFMLEEVPMMVQMEGADKALFQLDAACRLQRIAPWDLCAVMIHARKAALFGERASP